jgi:hypothetical protein
MALRCPSRDPIGYEAEFSLFAYVNGKPFTLIDPSGLKSISQVACMTMARDSFDWCKQRFITICSLLCGYGIKTTIDPTDGPRKQWIASNCKKTWPTLLGCAACVGGWPVACQNDYDCNIKFCQTGKSTFACGWVINPTVTNTPQVRP